MLQNIAITLILLVLVYFLFSSKPKKPTGQTNRVILYGPSSSGKTKLFYKLAYGQDVDATTSFEVNKASLSIRQRKVALYDIPGHSSFDINLSKLLTMNSVILFLVDCSKR